MFLVVPIVMMLMVNKDKIGYSFARNTYQIGYGFHKVKECRFNAIVLQLNFSV